MGYTGKKHLVDGRWVTAADVARSDDPENIAEEMADVRIMLDQLEIMLGNHGKVRRYEVKKLQRLSERLHIADEVK